MPAYGAGQLLHGVTLPVKARLKGLELAQLTTDRRHAIPFPRLLEELTKVMENPPSEMGDDNPFDRAEGFLPPADDLGLDGYEIGEVLGEGGFGRVYRARQKAFDRDVAIKVLAASALREETARRFERECRAVGALSQHPNIVTIYDSGISRLGRPYIVMDHMSGGSLGDRVRSAGPLSWSEAVEVVVKIGGAVETAHRDGILHRDVKPDNILFSGFGEPKLADFGVASIPGGYQTHTGAITASLAHAAPEVLEGRKATRAVDVYALGSTLFALVGGRAPFESEDGGLKSLIAKTLTQPVPDLRSEGVPDEVCSVIENAMAKDPPERFASVHQMCAALQAAQEGGGVPATPIPVPEAATNIVTYPIDLPASSEESSTSIRERRELTPPLPTPPRRRLVLRSPLTAGLIVLVLLGSSTGVIALRGRAFDRATPAGAPAGSVETEDRIDEPPESEDEQPTEARRSDDETPRKSSRAQRPSSFGGSQDFSSGGGVGTYGGGGGGYEAPPAPSSGSSGGATDGGGSGTGGGPAQPEPEPAPPPNEQPATRAFYHSSADDGRYFFTANATLANEERSSYDSHRVIAAVWASSGEGLIPLCPDPDRCEAFVSSNPPKKGAYKTLYFYVGTHGRFWTTDRGSVPSDSHAYLFGYAR